MRTFVRVRGVLPVLLISALVVTPMAEAQGEHAPGGLGVHVDNYTGLATLTVDNDNAQNLELFVGYRGQVVQRVAISPSAGPTVNIEHPWRCDEVGYHEVIVRPTGSTDPTSFRVTEFKTDGCKRRYSAGVVGGSIWPQGERLEVLLTDAWGAFDETDDVKYDVCWRDPKGKRACWYAKTESTGSQGKSQVFLGKLRRLGRYRIAWYVGSRVVARQQIRVGRSCRPRCSTGPKKRTAPKRDGNVRCTYAGSECLYPGKAFCRPTSERLYRRYGFTCVASTRTDSGRGYNSEVTVWVLRRAS